MVSSRSLDKGERQPGNPLESHSSWSQQLRYRLTERSYAAAQAADA
ncbi:MAG: hypothetical protein JSW55_01655 [Chloroflexota bacterium]|nr:MAG: hypothetical protein JSW55_01655 [Chloroflexota bacterium]